MEFSDTSPPRLRDDGTVFVVALLFSAATAYVIFNGAARVDFEERALAYYKRAPEDLVERYRQRRLERGEPPGSFRIHRNEPTWSPTQLQQTSEPEPERFPSFPS